MTAQPGEAPQLTVAAVALMRGVVDRDAAEQAWIDVVRLQNQLRDHIGVLGLDLVIDEAEGYAYLRSRPDDPDHPMPRLIPRHRLPFGVSLLLALLRKAIAEFDASATEGRLVVTKARLAEEMRTFQASSTNEARLVTEVERAVNKVVDLGFLRPMPREPGSYEVRRIIKAFVDAQWLGEFDARLAEYARGTDDGATAAPAGDESADPSDERDLDVGPGSAAP